MKIHFAKYQGTGNDFILLNNLNGEYDNLSIAHIKFLCDRRFGIGADGLIKINTILDLDFEVDYYNSNGSKSFCGNGARCAVAFAETLGINVSKVQFLAIDGAHKAQKKGDIITLDMSPLNVVNQIDSDFILNTGSPHFVRFVQDLKEENIVETGREIRYSDVFNKEGINVNLVEQTTENAIKILTYERGVEDETLSCGTGAVACALIVGLKNAKIGKNIITVEVKGGELTVCFSFDGQKEFTNVQLIGPAAYVFRGEIDV